MIEKMQQQPLNVTSPDWISLSSQIKSLDAYVERSVEASNGQFGSSDLVAYVRQDDDGQVHIRMPTLSASSASSTINSHPLYICEYKGKTYLSDYVVAFYHLGMTDIDKIYLGEVAYQGFSTKNKTLLQNVRSLYANDKYTCKSEQLIWLDQSLPVISIENGGSSILFDNIPSLCLSLFSPLDHSIYVEAGCYFQTSGDFKIEINECELKANLKVDKKDFLSANGPLAKKIYADISKQENGLSKNGLKQQWLDSGSELTLQDYIWQEHHLPFVKSLLTTLAYRHNKTLVWCQQSDAALPWKDKMAFQTNDKPIHNIFEAFQRLFFYGNKWLVKRWFFIPPLTSSKLVRRRKGSAHRVFLYATSLDYLMRFHTLN